MVRNQKKPSALSERTWNKVPKMPLSEVDFVLLFGAPPKELSYYPHLRVVSVRSFAEAVRHIPDEGNVAILLNHSNSSTVLFEMFEKNLSFPLFVSRGVSKNLENIFGDLVHIKSW